MSATTLQLDLIRPGGHVGRYVCLRRLAFGGMAELLLARLRSPSRFDKMFVIKRILPHLTTHRDFVRMFLREAQLASTLDHAGIAAVVDSGNLEGSPYLVMEYLHGHDVRAMLHTEGAEGPPPLPVSLSVIRDVANALHYAHERRGTDGRPLGLVHRDVSPSNIMVTYDGAVKLLDFGIAKANSQTQATRSGTIKGKLAYLSPEQCAGRPLDRRSDVFSLSVVLYEMTTGRRAFYGDNDFAVMNQVAGATVTPPQELVPGYPDALAAIVERGLAQRPEDRFATATALAVAVERFAADHGMVLSGRIAAEYLNSVFPEPPHPRDEPVPADEPTEPFAAGADTSAPRTASLRIRAGLAGARRYIAGALLVGIGVGAGVVSLAGSAAPSEDTPHAVLEGDDRGTPTADAAEAPNSAPSASNPESETEPSSPPRAVTAVDSAAAIEPVPEAIATPEHPKANPSGDPRAKAAKRRPKPRAKQPARRDTPPVDPAQFYRPPSER